MADERPLPILLPLDGSSHAEAALPAALTLARGLGSPLHLLSVTDEDAAPTPADVDRARAIFHAYAEGLMARCGAADVPHQATLVRGSAAEVILDFAVGARMVVLGSHGRGGMHAAVIGSVADKVVRGASRPTLVVPGEGGHALDGPLLVALDGSKAAECGLASARELASALKANVILVRAWSIPPPASVEFAAYPADLGTTMEEAARAYLTETALPGEQTFCLFASPVDALAEVATKVAAGAIVLTSQGKGFLKRVTLGSTTDRVLHAIRLPILVVPAADA